MDDERFERLPDVDADNEIGDIVEARRIARLAKEWQKSDELRDKLASLGWEVRDTKDGQTVTKRPLSG